jgi:hypothetical protein
VFDVEMPAQRLAAVEDWARHHLGGHGPAHQLLRASTGAAEALGAGHGSIAAVVARAARPTWSRHSWARGPDRCCSSSAEQPRVRALGAPTLACATRPRTSCPGHHPPVRGAARPSVPQSLRATDRRPPRHPDRCRDVPGEEHRRGFTPLTSCRQALFPNRIARSSRRIAPSFASDATTGRQVPVNRSVLHDIRCTVPILGRGRQGLSAAGSGPESAARTP